MIKLVASDIDGTILLEGNKKIPEEMYDIIHKLKEKGILFVAASGRQLESLQLLFAPVAEDISYITENGAICLHQGQKHVISQLDPEFAKEIIREVGKFPHCKLAISTPHTQYIKSGDDAFYEYMTKTLSYNITAIDDLEDISEPIVKIAFLDTVSPKASYELFHSIFGDKIRIATAGNSWTDFIPFDSNKGTALGFLLKQMNLTREEAISFGDQENDIEMLEYAGTSYAMAHAKPEIHAHATNITTSVEKILRKLL